MNYTIDNITVSAMLNLGTTLKDAGWDIFWQASGETDSQTALGTALGTVSLLTDIPDEPTFVVTPTAGDYTRQDHVVLPAFAVRASPPRKRLPYGIGDHRFEREVDVRIAGIATTSRQQSALASTIYEWLQVGENHFTMPIWDYETDPSNPTALEAAYVYYADVSTPEIASQTDSVRYRIFVDIVLLYLE